MENVRELEVALNANFNIDFKLPKLAKEQGIVVPSIILDNIRYNNNDEIIGCKISYIIGTIMPKELSDVICSQCYREI